jgi:hypothetical protein
VGDVVGGGLVVQCQPLTPPAPCLYLLESHPPILSHLTPERKAVSR